MRAHCRRRSFARATLLILALFAATLSPAVEALKGKTLRFGVIAEEANEPDRMLRVFAGFLSELRGRLAPRGIEVAPLVIASDLGDLTRKLKQGEVDMVIETVYPTLTLQDRIGQALSPQLAVVRHDRREYHSVFFARKSAGIKTLEDLRGRTLVLQAVRSTSAFAVPQAELSRRGIALIAAGQPGPSKESVSYVLAGAELNQAIWVLSGKGDAAAFNETDWANLPEKVRNELVIFHETRPMLRGVLSFRSGLEPEVRAATEAVLLALHQDATGQAALTQAAGITRFERLTPTDRTQLGEWKVALKGVPTR